MTETDFFERHDRFFETSTVGTHVSKRLIKPDRRSPVLRNRYKAIIDNNRPLLRDCRVLDLASHDGRWSLAALDAGAKSVHGVEGRAECVRAAERTFKHYGVDRSTYSFCNADVFDFLSEARGHPFDTILCLGFLYHTPRHYELFENFHRLRPRNVILDTAVIQSHKSFATFKEEPNDQPGMALRDADSRWSVVATPSRGLINQLTRHFGFRLREVDWESLGIKDWSQCEPYLDGTRATYVLVSKKW
jgi:hypothetical protein